MKKNLQSSCSFTDACAKTAIERVPQLLCWSGEPDGSVAALIQSAPALLLLLLLLSLTESPSR